MPDHPFRILHHPGHNIIVPFVCRRCGRCCRNYYPKIDFEMLPEIEREIQLAISSIQSRLQQDCEAHSAGRPTDCFFLDSGLNLCRIHSFKPDPCRSFPSLNDGGTGGRNCPGHREFRKMIEALSLSGESVFVRNPKSPVKPSPIPGREWPAILMTLKKAGASRRYRQAFISMNGSS